MGGSKENNMGLINPSNVQEGLRMTQNNRRALSSINQNINHYPCVIKKREFLGKEDIICDKNPPVLAHRPITRSFAAHLGSKQQHYHEETEKQTLLDSNPCGLEDCTINDVEEFESDSDDTQVPMYVKHTEAMLDEIDQMEEDEMEDAEEDLVMDIDASDSKNSLAVVEYIDDIYAFYKKTENSSCVSPNYLEHQFDINEKMRAILIDWLIEVHYKFELMDETLFLTVNLIDRFLEKQVVVRKKLQLVGVTAMLLACKYEEVSVPIVDDFVMISDKAYTKKEVLDMEKLMVNTLQFNMSVPTAYVFMRRFLKAAESDKQLELVAFFIMELCLVECEMLKFPPSLLAAAAIYTAQCSLYQFRQWSRTSSWYTTFSEDQLLECSKLMVTFHQKAGTGKLTGVFKKYSTNKFGYAARAEPAEFLLNH